MRDAVSSSTVAPFTHAFLCLDVGSCTVGPQIIAFGSRGTSNETLHSLAALHARDESPFGAQGSDTDVLHHVGMNRNLHNICSNESFGEHKPPGSTSRKG